MAKRRTAHKPGSVYAIRLVSGECAFGQVCTGGDFAFFDLKSSEPIPDIETVARSKVAFRVPVALDAPKEGGWRLLGVAALHGDLTMKGRYRHRPVGAHQVFLYTDGQSVPASEDEVKGLETLATWFSGHVEQRLEDHFSGGQNKWVQYFEADR